MTVEEVTSLTVGGSSIVSTLIASSGVENSMLAAAGSCILAAISAAALEAPSSVDSKMVKPSRTLAAVTDSATALRLTFAVCAIC